LLIDPIEFCERWWLTCELTDRFLFRETEETDAIVSGGLREPGREEDAGGDADADEEVECWLFCSVDGLRFGNTRLGLFLMFIVSFFYFYFFIFLFFYFL